MNYASSSGAAEDVASEIKALGGDAICVGANSGNKDDMERCAPSVHVWLGSAWPGDRGSPHQAKRHAAHCSAFALLHALNLRIRK